MTYASVAEIFEDIDRTRNELVEKVSALSDEAQNFRSSDASWSAANILEHLAIVESGLVPLVFKLLKKAEEANVPSDGTINPPVSFAERGQKLAGAKLEAPEMIRPGGAATVAESLQKLEESRATIHGLQSRLEAVDLSQVEFPHPFFGKLNLYEWLAFIGLHEARHLRQIENVTSEIETRS